MGSSRQPTFLFADLAGFTALTEAHGDEQAADLAAEFAGLIERLLTGRDAQLVKEIGDAVMVVADSATEALVLGLEVIEAARGEPGFPVVRVGMHTGPAVERRGDWFGATVNIAARVSALAGGGEALATETSRAAAGQVEGVECERRGPQRLKNVSEPVVVYRVLRTGAEDEGHAIDPVCRMVVDPAHSAGQLRHDGVEYHFCSLECVARFAAAPERFLDPGAAG